MTSPQPLPKTSAPEPVSATAQVAAAADSKAAWRRIAADLRSPRSLTLIILVGLVLYFSIENPSAFLASFNLRNIAIQAAVLMLLAIGMTYVIITTGIDLSVGGTLVLSSVASVKVMREAGTGGTSIVVGLAVALAVGMAVGAVNGLIITVAHINPLIATLGTLGMSQGLALILAKGVDIPGVPPHLQSTLGFGRFLGVPDLVWLAAVLTAAAVVVLRATVFGRHTYAIGSNEDAARRVGIPVDRHLVWVYTFTGLLAGLAGYVDLARFGTTSVNGHLLDNLLVITAVVLGGASLAGGRGSVMGTLIGVLIPAVLQNGFVIQGLQPFWQQFAVGAVLVVVVFIDNARRTSAKNLHRL